MFPVIPNLIAKLSALMQISVLISPAAQLQNYFFDQVPRFWNYLFMINQKTDVKTCFLLYKNNKNYFVNH